MKTVKFVAGVCGIAAIAVVPMASAQEALIEEIMVTAQKREQSMQDVPVAITAYSGAMIEEAGIKDMIELASVAPAFSSNQSQTSTNSSFSIRGIGTSSQNFGLESSVGLYIDNVYRVRQSSLINNLVDVEAVEVLRGPQGTLFGKNTPSGAINLRTIKPGHDLNAFMQVTAGDYGLMNVAAATNISAVEDVLAFRTTMFYGERDGFGSAVGFGEDELNDRDRYGVKLQAYYTPTDALDIRIIGDYAQLNETCCITLTRQDSLFAFGRTTTPTPMNPLGLIPGTDSILRALGGTTFTGADFENYTTALNKLPHSSNNDQGVSVELNYDFANTTLTSISSYREFKTVDDIDADFSDVELLDDTNRGSTRYMSQELRLGGEIGERMTYVAGLYLHSQDTRSISTLTLGNATNTYLLTANAQLGGLAAAVNAFSPPFPPVAAAFPDNATATDNMLQEQDSWAVFGQADFELSENWLLTAGLRYTDEEKKLDGRFSNTGVAGPAPDLVEAGTIFALIQAGLLDPMDPMNTPRLVAAFSPFWAPGWGLYTLPALAPQGNLNEVLEDDQLSGTVKLTWFATDSTMFYASYGTGYKAGGTNTDRIAPVFSQTFGPETSEAMEIGMKADFPEQGVRLNIALHDTEIEDLQSNAFTGAGFNLQNAGVADTYGAEVELWWSPSDSFDVQTYYVLSIADYKNFANGTCWLATPFHTGRADPGFAGDPADFDPATSVCSRDGGRVPSNAENTFFLAATKRFNIGGSTEVYVRGEYTYLSDIMTDGNNDPLKLKDSTDLVNLKMGFIFDRIDAELSIWGRNVTDEADYQTVFDVPVQDGKLNAYPNEPRTWGVTFRKSFQ